jgi:two-component system, LuxR family, response regulator FixJ
MASITSASGDAGNPLLIRAAKKPDSSHPRRTDDRGQRAGDELPAQPPAANDAPEAAIEILSGGSMPGIESQLAIDGGQPSVDVIVGGDLRNSVMAILIDAGFLARFWHQAAAFVRAAPKLSPGCVLVDVRKPDRMGMSMQDSIRRAGLNWPVVGIVSEGDVPTTVEVLKSGAHTVIEAPVDSVSLNRAIREAARRLTEIDDSEEVRHAYRCLSLLTRRETEVLRGLVAGLPNKTIAYDLGISPRTVEVYRANIMHKFEARSLSDVLRYAFAAKFG